MTNNFNNVSDVFRFLAIYLPQFHPIPENDKWWGKGFTEWTNLVKVIPRFRGHYQPRLPGELGFYDLRLSEIREAQVKLAKEHGIYGFAYYHYWFSGKRLLNRPMDDLLTSQKPNFPFCLIWANETWSKTKGPTYGSVPVDKKAYQGILIEQKYSEKDDLNHIRWLSKAFADTRYITVDGRPLFVVYRPSLLPNPRKTVEMWRNEAKRLGFKGLYLCMIQAYPEDDKLNPYNLGFDSSIKFMPDRRLRDNALVKDYWKKSIAKLFPFLGINHSEILITYKEMIDWVLNLPKPNYKRFPCVIPGWDNSARRSSGATIYTESTPKKYEELIYQTMCRFKPFSKDENLIFINSWNEWAEGSNIEPDAKWGRGYLEANIKAINHYMSNCNNK
jgi:lipopolysaccharide biosynthesis protein